jgi:hypothetical protein
MSQKPSSGVLARSKAQRTAPGKSCASSSGREGEKGTSRSLEVFSPFAKIYLKGERIARSAVCTSSPSHIAAALLEGFFTILNHRLPSTRPVP